MDKKTNASAQVKIANIRKQKIDASSIVETANIPNFQSMRIISFKSIMSNDLKTYIH